jgi:hypothetical protein
MIIRGDDNRRTVHERIQMEVREIAEVLVKQTGKTNGDVEVQAHYARLDQSDSP